VSGYNKFTTGEERGVCDCDSYIEDEEFEIPEGWEEVFKPWITVQAIVLGNG
jgi:hypothetical protein